MKFWKVILATVVIFVSGFVSGMLITKSYIAKAEREWREGRRPWGPRYFVGRLDRDLHLSEEQRDQIENLVRQSQQDLENLFDPIASQARQIHRQLREDIKAVLTAEQLETFEKIMNARRDGHRRGGRDRDDRDGRDRDEDRRKRWDDRDDDDDRRRRGERSSRRDDENPPPDGPSPGGPPEDGPPPPP